MKKNKDKQKHHKVVHIGLFLILAILIFGLFSFVYFNGSKIFATTYESVEGIVETVVENIKEEVVDTDNLPIYIPTPEAVKAIYMTQCVVGTPSFRKDLVEIADTTEVNSIIIDVKDYTGKIAFHSSHPELIDSVSDACGAYDMKEFVKMLNEKGIYTIARVTVFQDPFYTTEHPELAIKKASATSTLWTDYKGLSFIDVGARTFWDYIITLSKETYDIGFDEINYDYIRFPSDGNMRDIYYPFSERKVVNNPDTGKAEVVEKFFKYLSEEMKDYSTMRVDLDGNISTTSRPILSADLFGMITTNKDDLNIGQVLERATPYFDFIAPMVYPSHYPRGFNGWDNPNHNIYGVVKFSMDSAVERMNATTTTVKTLTNKLLSTTTPIYSNKVYSQLKLRPWLQDFDYGGNYDIEEVRAQIQATYDAGLTSWMLWSPSNRYTVEALEVE